MKINLRRRLFCCVCILSSLVSAGLASAAPWKSLFNGKDLTGWKEINGYAPFAVEDGAIVGRTVVGSPNSFLAADGVFGDFILELEVRQEGGPSNSGIQFRSLSTPDHENGRVHGYQCEIDPSERAWSGGIYDEARRGWLYPVSLNPGARSAYRYGEWNRIRIEAIGTSVRTWINDVPVAHVIDAMTPSGRIALQVHGIGSRREEAGRRVLFRNIRIQTGDLANSPRQPMFVRNLIPNSLSPAESSAGWRLLWDGSTAAGWHAVGRTGFPARGWKMSDGELVVNAPGSGTKGGDLVTDSSFGAFELQLEFKVTRGANSGVMYLLPDPLVDAKGNVRPWLEYQILDDKHHEDARKGVDGNRRLASLYDLIPRGGMPSGVGILPTVGAWMHARIVVHGDGRVEHWLNGVKVVDYRLGSAEFQARVARSKFAGIPGFGSLTPGPILLQDHGDEVHFRSIKVRE